MRVIDPDGRLDESRGLGIVGAMLEVDGQTVASRSPAVVIWARRRTRGR
jgi:hypothetical protein